MQIHTFLKRQEVFPSHRSNGIKQKYCRILFLKYWVFIIILFFSQEALLTYSEPFITGELSVGKCRKFPEKILDWHWGALKSFIHTPELMEALSHFCLSQYPEKSQANCCSPLVVSCDVPWTWHNLKKLEPNPLTNNVKCSSQLSNTTICCWG